MTDEKTYAVVIGGGEFDLDGEAGQIVVSGSSYGEAATTAECLRQSGLRVRIVAE